MVILDLGVILMIHPWWHLLAVADVIGPVAAAAEYVENSAVKLLYFRKQPDQYLFVLTQERKIILCAAPSLLLSSLKFFGAYYFS
jgi:hypothetical protein